MAPEDRGDAPEDLVRRIRGGDRSAEEEMVARYRRPILIVLSGARRDASAIDDLFQDTFRLAIEKIQSGAIRDPGKLPAFLCSLARNLTIEHFRRVARHPAAPPPDESSIPDRAAGPFEEAARSERAAIVQRVLAELPSNRDRQILYRFFIAEDDKERICRDLGLSCLHFNRVLFRAQERYRELYRKTAEGGAR